MYTKKIMWFIPDHWTKLYDSYRDEGAFLLADQLREMLRRMGFTLQTKDGKTSFVDWNESYPSPK